ncbi:MAG: hypothetical protein ACHQC8_00940 [Solirubrobacterales bacterium]
MAELILAEAPATTAASQSAPAVDRLGPSPRPLAARLRARGAVGRAEQLDARATAAIQIVERVSLDLPGTSEPRDRLAGVSIMRSPGTGVAVT